MRKEVGLNLLKLPYLPKRPANKYRRSRRPVFPNRTLFGMIEATGQVIFTSYFFSPSNDDRCFSADSGWAIELGPSMIRMLGRFAYALKTRFQSV
ncbi:hypothetical protein ACVWY2_002996 [Bradyrhizobium sp. JR6.1]